MTDKTLHPGSRILALGLQLLLVSDPQIDDDPLPPSTLLCHASMVHHMRDFGLEAQRAAEAHLAACQEALWDYESGEMQGEEDGSPASAPFCNCDTCIVREVLHAAWPIIVEAVKEELAADDVDPEEEDQHQSSGDDEQADVLSPERHHEPPSRR